MTLLVRLLESTHNFWAVDDAWLFLGCWNSTDPDEHSGVSTTETMAKEVKALFEIFKGSRRRWLDMTMISRCR